MTDTNGDQNNTPQQEQAGTNGSSQPPRELQQGQHQQEKQQQEQQQERKKQRSRALLEAMAAHDTPQEDAAERVSQLNAADNTNRGGVTDEDSDKEDGGNHPPPERPSPQSRAEVELMKVDTNDEEIEINNVRLFSLTELELEKFTNCYHLGLRKNLLHELHPQLPPPLATNLRVLDLFDNKIRKIPADFFSNFKSLVTLDLSYNQIKHIEHLEALAPTLQELYLVENKIKDVKGLESLVNLTLLELGGNRIRSIDNHPFDTLVSLKQLWLGKNKITDLGDAFVKLGSLERLSLQANRLLYVGPETFPEGALPALAELYLSENGLTVIENIQYLSRLTLVDYSMNSIRDLDTEQLNPTSQPALEEFWMTDNKLEDWEEVTKLAPFKDTLRVIYLERNPIEHDTRYRDKLYRQLPFVTQIDSWPVRNKENPEEDRMIHRRQ